MKDIKKIFRKLENEIKNMAWFTDSWEIYNRGPYLQLYKDNWYNQNQNGVHFETYIESREIKKKTFPICLHAENDCPEQQLFIAKFIELETKRIKNWKGYQIIGKGYNVIEKTLPLNFKNLEQRILMEFNQLHQLTESIEQALISVKNR